MQKLSNTEIISPYSVSSEDSPGLTHIQDDNANVEIEAMDLIFLFEVEGGVFSNSLSLPQSNQWKFQRNCCQLLDCDVMLV